MPSVQFGEPTELIAGDSWEWNRKVSDYPPSDGWTLKYAFAGPGTLPDVEATANVAGDYYEIRATPDQTENFEGGPYDMVAYVEKTGARHTILQAFIHVVSNIDARARTQSHILRVLEHVEAAIEGRLTSDMASFSINGRAVQRHELSELLKLRGLYLSKLRRLQTRARGKFGETVGVRFGRAS